MLKRILLFCLFVLFSMSYNLFGENTENINEEIDMDYIFEQVCLQQAKTDSFIKDVIYIGNSIYDELNKKGEVNKKVITERRIYRKGDDKYYEEYISMSIDDKELTEEEMNKRNLEAEKKSFSASSPLTEKVLDYYTFSFVDIDTLNNILVWIIEFQANEKKEEYINGIVFVSQEHFSVIRMEFAPAKNPSMVKEMSIIVNYNEIDGYWLPVHVLVDVRASLLWVFNKHIKIEDNYSDYQINTGLEDSFFEEKESE